MTAEHHETSQAPARLGVATRYAEAFFELAAENGEIEIAERDMGLLRSVIRESADLRSVLKSPVYDAAAKKAAMDAVAEKAGLSATTRNFIAVIGANNRLPALPAVVDRFFDRLAAHRGEVSAEAISAAKLNDDQARRLRGEIERIVGKAVNLTLRTDPDLLGGLVVKVGSMMIDSSLRTKLNKLKHTMKEA